MTKKDENTLSKHLAEKQKIENRLEEIQVELDSSQIAPGAISKMGMEAGDARMRFESFISQYSNTGVPENRRSEYDRLESVFEAAAERSIAAKNKRNSLKNEQEELKQNLLEMRYQLAEGELITIIQNYQHAETQKTALIKTIAEHEKKKETIQQVIDSGENTINSLMEKRQDILANMATGINDTPTSLDSIDSEINELIVSQNTEQQSLDNAEDTITGLNALLNDAEQKAKALRLEAHEAVCHHLIDRANIVGERYSNAAAQLGQNFAELQALMNVLESVSEGDFPVKITTYDAYRLYVPAFSIGSPSGAQRTDGLLNPDQINVHSVVQAERDNLKEMGFVW